VEIIYRIVSFRFSSVARSYSVSVGASLHYTFVTGWRFNSVYDWRPEEILQRDEETRVEKTTETDPETQGK